MAHYVVGSSQVLANMRNVHMWCTAPATGVTLPETAAISESEHFYCFLGPYINSCVTLPETAAATPAGPTPGLGQERPVGICSLPVRWSFTKPGVKHRRQVTAAKSPPPSHRRQVTAAKMSPSAPTQACSERPWHRPLQSCRVDGVSASA